MKRCEAQMTDRGGMFRRSITLVVRKAITRIEVICFPHESVALNLCQHRSSGDAGDLRVPLHDRMLAGPQLQRAPVQKHDIGIKRQTGHRLAHRLLQGRHDAAGVDDFSRNVRDMAGARLFAQQRRDFLASFLAQLLGIIQKGDLNTWIQHAGPRAHRSGQRPPPYFIDTDDHQSPRAIQPPLISKERPEALLFLFFSSGHRNP